MQLVDKHTPDLINGTYACENDKMLNDVLKREFGFQGCKYRICPDIVT
jgi:hypothetical protein